MSGTIVISGAGIAGLALAHWLERSGMTPVLVERAPRFEALGHYIALKGNGVEMVRRMGLFEACEAKAAPIVEVGFYSGSGRLLRREHPATLAAALGGYILFRRSDLHAALYDSVRTRVEIRFGAELADVRLEPDRVDLTLTDGSAVRADLLVGADGVHSHVRGLVFGQGFERPLGGHYVAFTAFARHNLGTLGRSYCGVGQMVSLLPVAETAVAGVIYLGAASPKPPHGDTLAMRDYLIAECAALPGEVRDALSRIGADDFVFSDAITQVEVPSIVRGRAALIGDAAHCPTFLSGMGSSLALQDAQVLAACLAGSDGDMPSALARYEETVGPIARRYRDSALQMRGLILDYSPFKARVRNLVMRIAPDRLFVRSIRRFYDAERPLPEMPVADARFAALNVTSPTDGCGTL